MFGLSENERMKELFTALGVEYTKDVKKAYSDGISAKEKRDISIKEVVILARNSLENPLFPYFITDASGMTYSFVPAPSSTDYDDFKNATDPEKIKADMDAKRKEITEYADTIVAIANDRLPDNKKVEAKVFVEHYENDDFAVAVEFYRKGKEMVGPIFTI